MEAFWYTDVHGAIGRSIGRFFKARCTPGRPCIELAFRYFRSKPNEEGGLVLPQLADEALNTPSLVCVPWFQSQTYDETRNLWPEQCGAREGKTPSTLRRESDLRRVARDGKRSTRTPEPNARGSPSPPEVPASPYENTTSCRNRNESEIETVCLLPTRKLPSIATTVSFSQRSFL